MTIRPRRAWLPRALRAALLVATSALALGEAPLAAAQDGVKITPKKQPRPASETEAARPPAAGKPAGAEGRLPAPDVDLGLLPDDASRLPRVEPPSAVHFADPRGLPALVGRSGELARPPFVDRTRRAPHSPRPAAFGATLLPGEHFKFDIYFGGNPTGIAEAGVVAREPGPFGSPDRVRLEGSARTSGVVALLTTLVYDMAAVVDAETGAPIETGSITRREGLSSTYRRREITSTYFGRGFVEIVDKKDERVSTTRKRLPVETFDPLSIMAWVRSLELKPGEKAKAYGLDGTVLLRVDITGRGPARPDTMPPIAASLGISPDQVNQLDGVITRVDRYGAAIPGKKAYKLRVWVSSDGRRIPLLLESDIWLGVVRLILTQYDPPRSPSPASG